jgi:hypothetical protein
MANVLSAALSSSFSRRLWWPVLFAVALAASIELFIQLEFHPTFWQKSTWLVHDPYHGESFDRIEVYERLSNLENTQPEIISVGDSSGFFSLQSTIVNRYLHGARYLSLNTGANQAYLGYRALAEYMLRRPNSRIKWVILYVFPQLLPEEELLRSGTLSPYVYDALVGPLSILTPPSAFVSPYVKYRLFNKINWHFGGTFTYPVPALQLHAQVKPALGWLPEFDVRADRVNPEIPFFPDSRSGILPRLGLVQSSSIYAGLDDFNQMVKRYGAHLAIAFAPISNRGIRPDDIHVSEAEAAIARFSAANPDVKFLFPLISRWSPEKFGMFNHISREYTFLSSMRLGKALDRLISDPDAFPNYVPRYKVETLPPINYSVTGSSDPKSLEGAFALYLYTQTLDEQYKRMISRRALDLLQHDRAFQYMIDDARTRIGTLTENKIEIGFDLSQMRARPITATGLRNCNERFETQWVQVDGILKFTYKSVEDAPTPEPVSWPENSHLFFPLIKEEGLLKFDGYCPENAAALNNLADSDQVR